MSAHRKRKQPGRVDPSVCWKPVAAACRHLSLVSREEGCRVCPDCLYVDVKHGEIIFDPNGTSICSNCACVLDTSRSIQDRDALSELTGDDTPMRPDVPSDVWSLINRTQRDMETKEKRNTLQTQKLSLVEQRSEGEKVTKRRQMALRQGSQLFMRKVQECSKLVSEILDEHSIHARREPVLEVAVEILSTGAVACTLSVVLFALSEVFPDEFGTDEMLLAVAKKHGASSVSSTPFKAFRTALNNARLREAPAAAAAAASSSSLVYYNAAPNASLMTPVAIQAIKAAIVAILLKLGEPIANQETIIQSDICNLMIAAIPLNSPNRVACAGAVLYCLIGPCERLVNTRSYKEVAAACKAVNTQQNSMDQRVYDSLVDQANRPLPVLHESVDWHARVFAHRHPKEDTHELDEEDPASWEASTRVSDLRDACRNWLKQQFPPTGVPSPTELRECLLLRRREEAYMLRTLTQQLAAEGLLGSPQTLEATPAQLKQLTDIERTPMIMSNIVATITHSMTPAVQALMAPMERSKVIVKFDDTRPRYWKQVQEIALNWLEKIFARMDRCCDEELRDHILGRFNKQFALASTGPIPPPAQDPCSQELECVAATLISACMKNHNTKKFFAEYFNPAVLCRTVASGLVSESTMCECRKKLAKSGKIAKQ